MSVAIMYGPTVGPSYGPALAEKHWPSAGRQWVTASAPAGGVVSRVAPSVGLLLAPWQFTGTERRLRAKIGGQYQPHT